MLVAMDEPQLSPWLSSVVGIIWLASIYTWIRLLARLRRTEPILPYEPRTPVPWGAPIALLAVLLVGVSVYSSLAPQPTREAIESLDPEIVVEEAVSEKSDASDVLQRLASFIIFQTLVTAGVLIVAATAYRTTARDFGLPTSAAEFARDVRIGVVAWLAAILPVHGLQILFMFLLGLREEEVRHPLVEMVTPAGPNFMLFFVAAFVAVVVAPVTEEIFFRLLLQGWLEKWEAWRVSRRGTSLPPDSLPSEEPTTNTIEASAQTTDSLTAAESSPRPAPRSTLSEPPPRGIAGLPFGWLPIFISSLLFALAHIGNGPDPFAIFFLALILGYVYQRTHRIVPSIVAHMLFNTIAMLVLWEMVFNGGDAQKANDPDSNLIHNQPRIHASPAVGG
jgi:membrane protease YdiL (CAAX protease family)